MGSASPLCRSFCGLYKQSGGNPGQVSSVQVRGKNNHASSMFFPLFFSKRERHKLFSDSQREGIFLRLSIKILLGVDTKHGYFLPGNNKIWTSRHPERRAGETVAGLLSSWPFPSSGEPSGGFFCVFPHPVKAKGCDIILRILGTKVGRGLSRADRLQCTLNNRLPCL